MGRNVEALKNLFIALGGTEQDFNATLICDAINAIAEVAGGGSGGGGLAVFKVVSEGGTYSLADGKTFNDIAEVIYAGEPVFISVDQYPGYDWPKDVYPLIHYSMDGTTLTDALFATVYFDTIGQTVMANMTGFKISSDNSVESTYLGGSLSA